MKRSKPKLAKEGWIEMAMTKIPMDGREKLGPPKNRAERRRARKLLESKNGER